MRICSFQTSESFDTRCRLSSGKSCLTTWVHYIISFVTELPISVENISIPGVNQVEELSDRKYKVLYNKQHTTPMNIIETINNHTRILDFTLQTTELESIISQIYRAGYTEKLAL